MARKQVQISLPENLLEFLDDWCRRTDCTRSEIIRNALRYYLNKALYEIEEESLRD